VKEQKREEVEVLLGLERCLWRQAWESLGHRFWNRKRDGRRGTETWRNRNL